MRRSQRFIKCFSHFKVTSAIKKFDDANFLTFSCPKLKADVNRPPKLLVPAIFKFSQSQNSHSKAMGIAPFLTNCRIFKRLSDIFGSIIYDISVINKNIKHTTNSSCSSKSSDSSTSLLTSNWMTPDAVFKMFTTSL